MNRNGISVQNQCYGLYSEGMKRTKKHKISKNKEEIEENQDSRSQARGRAQSSTPSCLISEQKMAKSGSLLTDKSLCPIQHTPVPHFSNEANVLFPHSEAHRAVPQGTRGRARQNLLYQLTTFYVLYTTHPRAPRNTGPCSTF